MSTKMTSNENWTNAFIILFKLLQADKTNKTYLLDLIQCNLVDPMLTSDAKSLKSFLINTINEPNSLDNNIVHNLCTAGEAIIQIMWSPKNTDLVLFSDTADLSAFSCNIADAATNLNKQERESIIDICISFCNVAYAKHNCREKGGVLDLSAITSLLIALSYHKSNCPHYECRKTHCGFFLGYVTRLVTILIQIATCGYTDSIVDTLYELHLFVWRLAVHKIETESIANSQPIS